MNKMKTLTINQKEYDITDDGAVRFDGEQILTPEQKTKARENIGAIDNIGLHRKYELGVTQEPYYTVEGGGIKGTFNIGGQEMTIDQDMNVSDAAILSHAEGAGHTLEAMGAHAEGALNNIASAAVVSHAEGIYNTVQGQAGHAEGFLNIASADASHAEGYNVQATGSISHAEGNKTVASGNNSHAEGSKTQATGTDSHAEGSETVASYGKSHAEGNKTRALASGSHSEGFDTEARAVASHAEGAWTLATAQSTHAEGERTSALEYTAHAEGLSTVASGMASHAEGNKTVAHGVNSHAQGEGTIAGFINQTVLGSYNIRDSVRSDQWPIFDNVNNHKGNFIEIVGNGDSDASRSNARTLDWDGNEVLAGTLKVLGSKEVATLEYVTALEQRLAALAAEAEEIHPRLLISQIAHKPKLKRSDSYTEDFRVFVDVYQTYNHGEKATGAMYALTERPVYNESAGTSRTQSVYRSNDGGETWEKMGDISCFIPADVSNLGTWYNSIFVDPASEYCYFLRTNDGLANRKNTLVSGYFGADGTWYSIGSLEVGTRGWLSNTNSIDVSADANWTSRVTMFGEYGTVLYDEDPTYRIWRTTNGGATWTPCLEIEGDSGALGTGEIRHFHCVQRDPYVAGHWWAAAGDENHQCKIFRTTDDGLNWEQIFPLPGVAGTQQERTCSFVFDKKYIYYGMDTPTVGKDNVKIFRIDKSKIGTTDAQGNPIESREVVATVDSGYPVYCLTKCEYPEGFLVWSVFEKSTNNITNRHVVEFYDYVTQKLYPVGVFDTTDAMEAGHDYVGFTGASRYTDRFTGVSVVRPHFSMQQGKYGYGAVSRHIKVKVTT